MAIPHQPYPVPVVPTRRMGAFPERLVEREGQKRLEAVSIAKWSKRWSIFSAVGWPVGQMVASDFEVDAAASFAMAWSGLCSLTLLYASLLTIRAFRQRDNPWRHGDAMTALVVNAAAWFLVIPSLLLLLLIVDRAT